MILKNSSIKLKKRKKKNKEKEDQNKAKKVRFTPKEKKVPKDHLVGNKNPVTLLSDIGQVFWEDQL